MSRTSELVELLKKGFDWMVNHPDKVDENMGIIDRSQPIVEELKGLGISEEISFDLLLRGIPIKDQST